jgi:hypothetical protein
MDDGGSAENRELLKRVGVLEQQAAGFARERASAAQILDSLRERLQVS